MPDIRDMFPRRFFSGKDLAPGERLVLTISAVRPLEAKARAGGFGQQPAQVTTEWALYCDELPKPIQLRKGRAAKLAALFSEPNSDKWVGKRFEVYHGATEVGGELVENCLLFNTQWQPQLEAPRRAPRDGRPIPADAMDRFMSAIKARGRSWDDFLRWVKATHPDALAEIYGVGLDAVPRCVLPVMKTFMDEANEPAETTTLPPVTALTQAATSRPTSIPGAARPTPQQIKQAQDTPDDIPF